MRHAIRVFFVLLGLIVAAYSFYVFATVETLTSREATLLSIFLTIVSTVISWIMAEYYGDAARKREIDMIAKNSSEIVLAQTVTLWELEADIASERTAHSGSITDREFDASLNSIANRIRAARRINNTQKTAWEGLASKETTKELKGLFDTTAELYSRMETLRAREEAGSVYDPSDRSLQELHNEINDLRARIPSSIAPSISAAAAESVVGAADWEVSKSSDAELVGKVTIATNRPTRNLTVTYRGNVPDAFRGRTASSCSITAFPPAAPQHESQAKIDLEQGRLNVHLTAKSGNRFPIGKYVVEFRFP